MRIQVGDMWTAYDDADLFVITTNGIITKDYRLVMGRGIALQAKERLPDIDLVLGSEISTNFHRVEAKGAFLYGFLPPKYWPREKFGCLQVKYRWYESANVALIEFSVRKLRHWLNDHPDASVHMNYPGIGNGHLTQEAVRPIIEVLPDNVTVWKI